MNNKIDLDEIKNNLFIKGKIVSDSMTPLLAVGTEITIEVQAKDLKRFDIIVFYNDDKLICHFLWNLNRRIKPIFLQTRNLKNLGQDLPVSYDLYVGKVISHKLRIRDIFRIMVNDLLRN